MLRVSRILRAQRAAILDNPQFTAWFRNSQMVDGEGNPQKFFHGTSKDKIFDKFNEGKRGIFFTLSPEAASDYATENDSRGLKYDWDSGKYKEVNTTPRVMGVYLRMENPYRLSAEELQQHVHAENYAKFQREIADRAKMKGHDGIIYPDSYVVFSSNQAKSFTGNKGTFNPNKPQITASRR